MKHYACISRNENLDREIDSSEVKGHVWEIDQDTPNEEIWTCACGMIRGTELKLYGLCYCYYLDKITAYDHLESGEEPYLVCPLSAEDHLVKGIIE